MPERQTHGHNIVCPGCAREGIVRYSAWPELEGRHRQIMVDDLSPGFAAHIDGQTGANLRIACACGVTAWRNKS